MTSTERGPSWPERLNPRNWSLAVKLVAVGLVPTLLALALGVLRVSDQADAAAALGRSNRLLEVREQVADTAEALRAERNEAVVFVAGDRTGDRTTVQKAVEATDAQLDTFRDVLGEASALDTASAAALRTAQNGFVQLVILRSGVTNGRLAADDVAARYNPIVQRVDELDRSMLRQLRTADVSGLIDALTAVSTAREQLALEHTVLAGAIAAPRLRDPDRAAVNAAEGALAAAFAQYQVALSPEQLNRFGNISADSANAARTRLRDEILATPDDRSIAVDPAAWNAAYRTSAEATDRAAAGLRGELASTGAAAEARASNLAGVNSVILMLGLMLAVAIIVLLIRSLLGSLRVLRTSALDVAEKRLPRAVESMRAGETPDTDVEPVPLSSRDEIGQVARAFDAVHGQAVRLAAEQAALQSNVSTMFVNLSRRSQALVERQLQLIEQLEAGEQDPDQLSNLFQLDSLATRMRRNSENLLVLAGTDLGKRNGAPVPVVDVLRAAVSEIEQYQRVVVQTPPAAMIAGQTASDVVHLLAELLDNATNFSPPDAQVVMSTTRTAGGSVLVEIADRGVGMREPELGEVNERLAGPSAMDVSASRRMGLFVVGQLAARHGISVRLGAATSAGAPGGLTASITVPAHLVPTSDTGVGSLAPVPSDAAFDAPEPAATNGHVRPGTLAAYVTGNDGPMSPAGGFEGRSGGPVFPPLNGSGSGSLPTRRPGRSMTEEAATGPSTSSSDERPADAEATEAGSPPDVQTRPEPAAEGSTTTDTDSGDDPVTERLDVTGSGSTEEDPVAPAPPTTPMHTVGPRVDHTAAGPEAAGPEATVSALGEAPDELGEAPDELGEAPDELGEAPDELGEAPDELFAPSVPVIADPELSGPPRQASDDSPAERSETGGTTPIFQEIASAWFRSNRPVPVDWSAENGGDPTVAHAEPAKADAPARADADTEESPALDAGAAVGAPRAGASFAGPADEGWRAAESTVNAPVEEELTSAGLPKRQPRARLVPGSAAGSAVLAPPATAARSADAIRGRLASYQQGVRQGRENKLRQQRAQRAGRDTEPASAPREQQDEEAR